MMKTKDLRFVSLVPYHLSGLQAGLQTAHCVARMSLEKNNNFTPWADEHQTIIILNGGTTKSIRNSIKDLERMGVDVEPFKEPDLDNALTAAGFIVDYKNDHHVVGYLRQFRLAGV
jgi:hypothetical protein